MTTRSAILAYGPVPLALELGTTPRASEEVWIVKSIAVQSTNSAAAQVIIQLQIHTVVAPVNLVVFDLEPNGHEYFECWVVIESTVTIAAMATQPGCNWYVSGAVLPAGPANLRLS